jgi:large repetitive protein
LKENFDRFNSQIYKEKEMADFRRCILAFAVVALLLGLVPTASAQVVTGVQCIANSAVPPTLRSEGQTELVGDIVLNCSGGTPTPAGSTIPQANITIFLNTQVTSRLYNSSNQSEAILTVDEPTAAQTSASQTCTSISGCQAIAVGAGNPLNQNLPNANEFKTAFTVIPGSTTSVGCTVSTTTGCVQVNNPNVFEGSVSGNSVTFVGIPIDPPGTQATRIYRITNLRANATIPAPGGSGTPGQIIALISATPATSPGGLTSTFSINNPTQIVGFVQTSLSTSITGVGSTSALTSTGIALQQCTGAGVTGGKVSLFGQLNFTELFPTAFKTRTVAGALINSVQAVQDTLGIVYNSESGYVNPRLASPLGQGASGLVPPVNNEAGLADYGTRLKATFNNIPNGVSIFVSVNNHSGQSATTSPTTGTFAALTSSEIGVGFSPVSSTTTTAGSGGGASTPPATVGGVFQVPITNGSGVAVWEVLAANPLANQTFSFDYFVVASPSPSTNSPAVGIGTVNLSYAPTPSSGAFSASAGAVASQSLPIPRFIDTSTATNVVAVTLCRTNLLYPYVANTAGFDTGLAISNTSTDPFGTAAQQGPCTLNFFGSNAPAAVTTPTVASGTSYTTLASSVAPNFLGYVIAVCNFQYGHGFAFVSDVGARNLAMGYLALIIPDPARNNGASPFDLAGSNSGEQLGY